MKEIVKLLDKNLEYIDHVTTETTIHIKAKSKQKKLKCPYCGHESKKQYGKYTRRFQDLPIQGKKVQITLETRKMYCMNKRCKNNTFSECFDFIERKATRTKRLEEEILKIALNTSSVKASKMIKTNVANIGKSSICELIKKKKQKRSPKKQ